MAIVPAPSALPRTSTHTLSTLFATGFIVICILFSIFSSPPAVFTSTFNRAKAGFGAIVPWHPGYQPEEGLGPIDPAYAGYTGPAPDQSLVDWGIKDKDSGLIYPPSFVPAQANTAPRQKAGFVVLVRNSELEDMKKSMKNVEDRFNRKYDYPWYFFNNEPFTEEFKAGVRKMTRAPVYFSLVPKEHWSYPDWIDQEKAAQTRKDMADIIYGSSESYRHMCRYNSGFFYRQELLKDLDYYWRVEPGIELDCDVDYDVFNFMAMNNKTYGFTIAMYEYEATIPTLWSEVKKFAAKHPDYIARQNSLYFMTDEPQRGLEPGYNLCHFWSNFEIGDLRFWRSKQYNDFFEHLDKAGGFFYERWGDAPVHSIAAALFLDSSRIHQFEDIAYYHLPYRHCPQNKAQFHDNGKCSCDPGSSFDLDGYSCMTQWWRVRNSRPW